MTPTILDTALRRLIIAAHVAGYRVELDISGEGYTLRIRARRVIETVGEERRAA